MGWKCGSHKLIIRFSLESFIQMITLQNVEISWTKKARGGKLAALRNSIPHEFEISENRKFQRFDDCILLSFESKQFENSDTSNLKSIISSLFFEIEDEKLLIKIPKYNGYDLTIAKLNNCESIQFIKFSKSMDYEFVTSYKKSIINLVFASKKIPLNFFLNHSFKYKFDEKSKIWY